MNSPLRTPEDYELFLYTLMEQFPSILSSTLVFVRRGAALARAEGELFFPPNIKHNRIPAPGLSFTQANLPVVIEEIERLLELSTP